MTESASIRVIRGKKVLPGMQIFLAMKSELRHPAGNHYKPGVRSVPNCENMLFLSEVENLGTSEGVNLKNVQKKDKKMLTPRSSFEILRPHTEKHNTSHMRTKTLLLTAALAAAGATSMAQTVVYSVNAVGYANINIPSGFSIIACPFEQTSGDYSLNTLLPPGNPDLQDAAMYIFDAGRFLPPMSYDETDGWDCGQNCAVAKLPLGGGAFILSPRNLTVTFVGQVKQSVGGAPVDNAFASGFSIRSSMIPQQGTANGLQLFGNIVGGNDTLQDATLYHFNIATNPKRYDPPASYDSVDKWDPDYNLRIGEGFFLLAPRAGAISRVFTVN